VLCYVCSAGGVLVSSASGSIKCSNVLDHRLAIAYSQSLPEIREMLFGTVVRA
jgi:vacuolar-type H+-ATPase subunit E/Vma4